MTRRLRSHIKLAQVTCADALVPEAAGAEEAKPVWVQVATAGDYKGYAGGELAFTFDKNVFTTIVQNFKRHPSFRTGADGVGCGDVVAWDFHHASEMDATSGSIPTQGTPAQGWVLDLEVRTDAKGKCTLWALTRWLEPARTYVKNQQYRWASVSVVFDAIDPVTGKNNGATLTSIALTNQPFIEGMEPLAASKQAASKAMLGYFYAEPASCAEDALEAIRRMIGLPETADAIAVVSELEKVRAWSESGEVPVGVEVDEIVEHLRRILNLPTLTDSVSVMAEVGKLIAALTAESTGTVEAPSPAQQPATPAQETENMLSKIAEKLGVQANESAVLDAVGQLVELRGVVASSAGLEGSASTKVTLKATIDAEAVRAKYGAMLKALGVADPDAALDKLATLIADGEQLKSIAPELSALKARVAEMDAVAEEADVEGAMESTGIDKAAASYSAVREAIKLSRKSTSRDEFLKRYPKSATTLTRTVSSERATTVNATRSDSGAADAIDIAAYEGTNITSKACAFVKASVTGASSWEWDRVHAHAVALVRAGKVKG